MKWGQGNTFDNNLRTQGVNNTTKALMEGQ